MLSFRLENPRNKGKNIWKVSVFYFSALALIFGATLGLLFLESFRVFKSDISVLIIPKNESVSVQADQILENLADITHRLSFYDRVLFDNPQISDPFANQTKDERKARWNETFSVQRLPNSTTLNISVFNKNKEEANKISRQVALSLSGVAGRFYDIQNDLDFRIIEGPISSPIVRFRGWLIFLSIASGAALAYLVLLLANILPTKALRKEKARFDWSAVEPEKNVSTAKQIFFSPSVPVRKAAAPSNLPIAEEETKQKEEIFPVLEERIPAGKGEPTDEEYRERLNKLLRGEI